MNAAAGSSGHRSTSLPGFWPPPHKWLAIVQGFFTADESSVELNGSQPRRDSRRIRRFATLPQEAPGCNQTRKRRPRSARRWPMEFLIGRPISPGYGRGIAVVFDSDVMVELPRYQIEPGQVDRELERLRLALARSSCGIQELEARVSSELGYPRSLIFSAHLALLHDKAFLDRIQVRICRDRMNAEQALDLVVEEIAEQMRTLVNPYLQIGR